MGGVETTGTHLPTPLAPPDHTVRHGVCDPARSQRVLSRSRGATTPELALARQGVSEASPRRSHETPAQIPERVVPTTSSGVKEIASRDNFPPWKIATPWIWGTNTAPRRSNPWSFCDPAISERGVQVDDARACTSPALSSGASLHGHRMLCSPAGGIVQAKGSKGPWGQSGLRPATRVESHEAPRHSPKTAYRRLAKARSCALRVAPTLWPRPQ